MPSNSAVSDLTRLLSGAALGQLVAYAATPLIVRLFDPASLGGFAIYTSIAATLGVVACLRYELAIPLPRRRRDAATLVWLAMALALLTGLIVFVALRAVGGASFGLAPDLGRWVWLAPIGSTLGGLSLALSYWNLRSQRYERIAAQRFANRATCVAFQIGAGVAGWTGSIGLILPHLLGQLAGLGVFVAPTTRRARSSLLRRPQPTRLWKVARRYRRFATHNGPAGLVNQLGWSMPPFLLAAFYSPETVGCFALADLVLRTPLSLVGSCVSQVYYQRAAAAVGDPDEIRRLTAAFYSRLASLSLGPLTVLAIGGPTLFEVCFGTEWRPAGVYCRYLSVWAFFWFTASPLSQLYDVLERHRTTLAVTTLITLVRSAALVIGGLAFTSAEPTVGLLALSSAGVYAIFSARLLADAGVPWLETLGWMNATLRRGAPIALAAVLACEFVRSGLAVTLCVATLIVAYLLLVVAEDPALRNSFRRLFRLPITPARPERSQPVA